MGAPHDLGIDVPERVVLAHERPFAVGSLLVDPPHPLFQRHARSLWAEPRFQRILAVTGLEDYWRASGMVPDFRR